MALLTKSKYIAGMQCPKLLWYMINDKSKIPAFSKEAQYRMDTGTDVGVYATRLFPDGINIPTDGFIKNINLTKNYLKKAIADNTPLFEAGIMINNCYSRIDILKPNPDGTYEIIEVKSSTKVKDENIHDVSFQKYCCEMSGLEISKCSLCHLNNKYVRYGKINVQELFTVQDITKEVDTAIVDIKERIDSMFDTINSARPPTIAIGNHCTKPYTCNLIDMCWAFLPENNVFDLYRGASKSTSLFDNNILAIKDIPADFKLTINQEIQKKCEQEGNAHVEPNEIRQFLDTLVYPLYYLDFETFSPAIPKYDGMRPYQRVPFQFSLHIEQEDGSIDHIGFLAKGKDDPRPKFLARLKEVIGRSGSVVVYNQAFEKGVLNELARDFPQHEEWINDILPRVVDLLVPFRNFHYYHPSQKGSASIKKVLPAITDLSYDDMDIADGSDASSSFEQTLFSDMPDDKVKEVRNALEKYCELDTWAEVAIVKELKKLVNANNNN